MRVPLFVLTGLLVTGTMVGAQTTPGSNPTPAAAAAAAKKLDNYLLRWEQEMKKINTLSANIARIDKDKSFGTLSKVVGEAKYMKVGTGQTAANLALLELKREGKNEIVDKVISTGTYLYQFYPPQKEIRAYELPKPKPGQVAEDGFLGLLFGMKAEEAKQRFDLTLAKEDDYYVYVYVAPKFPADKVEFARARLVLNRDSFLPRQLWFETPNGTESTWDIPVIKTGITLDRREFDAPRTPPGWKMVPGARSTANSPQNTFPANGTPPPRVIRQNDR